ncbi:hypothetical protein ACFV5G_13330, partial [Streptomyces sp. NPDC059766]|uniref:hypothetical protein n=1 Tax=Streptomyces sp. NPDC059766 TaxID=3346940 RepID=UPI00365D5E40
LPHSSAADRRLRFGLDVLGCGGVTGRGLLSSLQACTGAIGLGRTSRTVMAASGSSIRHRSESVVTRWLVQMVLPAQGMQVAHVAEATFTSSDKIRACREARAWLLE